MTIGVTTNNPGNLTVNKPGQILYTGQTGTYAANGLNYATFPDPATGGNALVDYINRNLGDKTASQFAGYYLNGNVNSIQPTAANPNPSSWLSTITAKLGIGPNDQIASTQVNQLAGAIQKAEGNTSLGDLFSLPGTSNTDNVGGTSSTVPATVIPGTDISNAGMTGVQGNDDKTSATASTSSGFLSFLTNLFSLNTGERFIAIVVGGGLILITITVLIVENKTVQQTATRIASVAS